MGDRYFDTRHPNLEFMLRRPDSILPGIGHNGGPPLLDMSWNAWVWRKAVQKAWATPPREVALRRLQRAERLGVSYRDYTAALLDTGVNLSTALLPLHHLYDGAGCHPAVAAAVRRFEGRLLLLADDAVSGQLDAATRKRLLARLNADFGGKAEALLVLPFRPQDGEAARALHLRRLLKKHNAPRRECFWLGATPAESRLAEQAGLGWFKPVAHWFLEKDTA
ncbi:MAG: hypothetical protein OJJ21_09330 [Ferrovibrio sp.]|uniref:hypothetical protein n=1 Tax=Ferrovibrio sp. TaxID=1917215 RepID=UPI00260D4CDC|nr:hypothetical protein [Ferrovibrio sp.]MCW0233786.1 hypothetical protein [Ferrovibrio sp.]